MGGPSAITSVLIKGRQEVRQDLIIYNLLDMDKNRAFNIKCDKRENVRKWRG